MTANITISSDDIARLAKLAQGEAQNIVAKLEAQGLSESEAQMIGYGSIIGVLGTHT